MTAVTRDRADFRFVIMTDTHVDVRPNAADNVWWNRMLVTRAETLLGEAVRTVNRIRPDFVVHCGDLTNASDTASFRAAHRILRGLEMPLHFVPGNHDTYARDGRDVAAELFGLEPTPLHHVAYVAGWRLLCVDSAYWLLQDGTVSPVIDFDRFVDVETADEELDWFRERFAEDPDTPTLFFTHVALAFRPHYPVSRLPGGEPVLQRPVRLQEFTAWRRLHRLLRRQRAVKAAFYGHGHWHDCLVRDGLLFCQTAALVEYPCEMRLVTVFPDRLETEVVSLDDCTCARDAYIPEYGNRWVDGRPRDRSRSHPLRLAR